jgi:hypothetical protein
MNVLLCGPTALLLLGISYEIFAFLFMAKGSSRYFSYLYTCAATAMLAFSLFAFMDTYILKAWDTSRLIEYIFVKGSLTAVASGVLSILVFYLIKVLGNYNTKRLNPYVINSILGCMIIALWLFGSFTKL